MGPKQCIPWRGAERAGPGPAMEASALTRATCRRVSPALQQEGTAGQLDQFGHITPMRHVDRGWLSVESVVQLKLYGNPVELWKKRQRRVSGDRRPTGARVRLLVLVLEHLLTV